jgi:non-canonical purine NTP pyrophosphatase (RdgB/HAM1 family)
MPNVVFVTGNPNKAKYFSELVGMPIEHHSAETEEIQSLDLVKIAKHKAKDAYAQLKRPVLVEDTGLVIQSLGNLPGPFIKWFIEEIGVKQICRLADMDKNRSAEASDTFVYYDGKEFKHFVGSMKGSISEKPKGIGGYDWDRIFIPSGNDRTLAEMEFEEYKKFHLKIKPVIQIRDFLQSLDNQ